MKALNVAGLLLPALLAVDASAAFARLSPISPRVNPYAGLPKVLPSPLSGPLAGQGLTLPAPVMTPTLVLAAPAPALPELVMDAGRENVRNPFAAVLPDAALRLAAPHDGAKPASPESEELGGLFDGSRRPQDMAWQPILPRERLPQSRRHGLPEDDLESELGLGR